MALHVSTEKARSEFIIAPILAEVRLIANMTAGLFSGVDFSIDEKSGKDVNKIMGTSSTNLGMYLNPEHPKIPVQDNGQEFAPSQANIARVTFLKRVYPNMRIQTYKSSEK